MIIAKPLRKAIKQQKSLCLESCPHIGLAKKFEFFYDVMGMGKMRSRQENERYQGNISCKDGLNKGQKWYGPNRSRRYEEEVARIHTRTVQKRTAQPDNHDGVVTHLEPDILECEVKWA